MNLIYRPYCATLRPCVLGVILLLMPWLLYAQQIEGIVKNENGDLLPFSSILIKGTPNGYTANNQGKFQFNLSPGSYTLICQHVGYEKQEKNINVDKAVEKVDFILMIKLERK